MSKKHFVSKYKYSHDERRKQFRQWAKDGLVTLIGKNKDGFLYSEHETNPITVTRTNRKVKFSISKD